MAGVLLFYMLVRIPLRAAGVAGIGLIMPLFMIAPMLVLGWYQRKERQRPQCPSCELPLSFRPLGPSHGMWECPALCGYRRLVGDPRAAP